MKKSETFPNDELVEIPPFDFEHSQPNKFADQYDKDVKPVVFNTREDGLVKLEPDVAQYFPDSESVNAALRALITALSTVKKPTLSS